jgi:hypothetical protein
MNLNLSREYSSINFIILRLIGMIFFYFSNIEQILDIDVISVYSLIFLIDIRYDILSVRIL